MHSLNRAGLKIPIFLLRADDCIPMACVVRQSDLNMTTYFIRTKVKKVYGHKGDLSVRCDPGRGVGNEDMRWSLELEAQVLWPSVFFSAAELQLFFMLRMTLHRCRGMNATKLVPVLQVPRNQS
jgi:hypothetical protein